MGRGFFLYAFSLLLFLVWTVNGYSWLPSHVRNIHPNWKKIQVFQQSRCVPQIRTLSLPLNLKWSYIMRTPRRFTYSFRYGTRKGQMCGIRRIYPVMGFNLHERTIKFFVSFRLNIRFVLRNQFRIFDINISWLFWRPIVHTVTQMDVLLYLNFSWMSKWAASESTTISELEGCCIWTTILYMSGCCIWIAIFNARDWNCRAICEWTSDVFEPWL